MSLYQQTRNSGAVWLGKMPDAWMLKRVSSLFTHRNEKVSDKEYGPLSVTKKGVLPQLETAAKTKDGDNRKKVLRGDFVINSRSDRRGSSGLSNLDGSVSLINIVLAESKLEPRYAHHLLRSYPFQEEFYRWGQGIVADLWSTNYQRMKNIILPVPPQSDQQRIANYLDEQTARIDDLIAKQKDLLDLLEEKRRALITLAVTGGIDAITDTGGVFLNLAVPPHWRVKKMKYLVTRRNPSSPIKHKGNYIALEHIGSFAGKLVSPGSLDGPAGPTLSFEEGDVLFGKLRPYLAKTVVTETAGICSCDLLVLTTNTTLTPEFLKYYLLSKQFVDRVDAASYGVKMPRVSWDFVSNIKVAFPDTIEQKAIADKIESEETSISRVKSKIVDQIQLLQERRISLISHTVLRGIGKA